MFISHVRICLKNKYGLNFKVKAYHDAHISLLQIDGSTFEIVIGQMKNSASALYKTDERGITPLLYSGQGLLDCSKFEHYFIRWSLTDPLSKMGKSYKLCRSAEEYIFLECNSLN